ncbi:DUF2267 domain-containing protein [Streptomyces oceani]|uniref:DUF2267 domain-containing protein n=1 Tax=Streptomyces oceani TaxID=1075402 RepID=A0A1E7KJN9_9ACTN|nr:DUF2267 domain-containing protein [Streptomyces oceani]OEV04121.1 hypothetical protein AN216_07845 [Streptomyces oceani]
MHYEEFIGRVQERAALSDRQSSERAVWAVLSTLAERLPDGTAEHLAAQLPRGAAVPLREVIVSDEGSSPREREVARWRGERFDLTTFAGRVAWRDATSQERAAYRTAAVVEVLDAAVAPELMRKLEDVLPADIREVLPSARVRDAE